MRSVALLGRPGAAVLTCCVAIITVLALASGGAASAADRAAPADVATELDPTIAPVVIQPVTVP